VRLPNGICEALARALAASLLALLFVTAEAEPAERVDVYLFWAIGCPHCEREIEFLKRLEAEEPRLRVHYLELSSDAANGKAFAMVVDRLALQDPAVPLTLVGDAAMIGYATDATSGEAIGRRIDECLASKCPDTMGSMVLRTLAGAGTEAAPRRNTSAARLIPPTITVPFVGEIRTADLSLPVLTWCWGLSTDSTRAQCGCFSS
jgi:thiol-disulfide isomerase/thioredoxin